MTLDLSDLPGIKHLVLRWGRHVEVLVPATLRDEVREELAAAAAQYAKAPLRTDRTAD